MMQRDLLEAPKQPTESDEILLTHLGQLHETNKRLLELKKREVPRNRLSIVFDTPGKWDANYQSNSSVDDVPIGLHFESNGKKVTAYHTIVTWNLVNDLFMEVNHKPFRPPNTGGFTGSFILNTSPFNSGFNWVPIIEFWDPIESLWFLSESGSPNLHPVFIQPQVQNVVPNGQEYGVVTIYAWGE